MQQCIVALHKAAILGSVVNCYSNTSNVTLQTTFEQKKAEICWIYAVKEMCPNPLNMQAYALNLSDIC